METDGEADTGLGLLSKTPCGERFFDKTTNTEVFSIFRETKMNFKFIIYVEKHVLYYK